MTTLKTETLILVVDDDWMNREMMQAYLQRFGFAVALAHDADSAVERAETLLPRLILLDVRMGEKDGYEVCQELKSIHATRDIPVVMLSALTSEEAKRRAHEAGAIGFLTKTMHLESILEAIRSYLGASSAR